MKKILVALSGGVDSAVAALLLKKEGYAVSGAYIKTWMQESEVFADCPWERDRDDARAVAQRLGIDFEVVNLIEAYRERIVTYLVEGYRNGVTPNPDALCNREVKFGVFLDYALRQGFEAVATGHYCRKGIGIDGHHLLKEGLDNNKDQSYFLALLSQDQVRRAIFPVGAWTKSQGGAFALEHNLPNARKKDSQGICFLGAIKINDFLAQYIPDRPGEIINPEGHVVGCHLGLHRYTIGQRRGIGVPSNTDHKCYVVVGKDLENNQLRVAFDRPENTDLYTDEAVVHGLSFIGQPLEEKTTLQARARYRDPPSAIVFEPFAQNSARIYFKEPQRALASGQVLALYDGDVLLGGGFYA